MYIWNSKCNCFVAITEEESQTTTETVYTEEQVSNLYANCIAPQVIRDVNGVPQVTERFTAEEKQELAKINSIGQLESWFNYEYRTYFEMFTRRNALGLTDTIVDTKRNKTYTSLAELYAEAEVVATEIKNLR